MEIPPALRRALADTSLRDYDQKREQFETEMAKRFYDKALEGFHGWDDSKCYHPMIDALNKSVEKMNWVDVANFALFLWNLDEARDLKEKED